MITKDTEMGIPNGRGDNFRYFIETTVLSGWECTNETQDKIEEKSSYNEDVNKETNP